MPKVAVGLVTRAVYVRVSPGMAELLSTARLAAMPGLMVSCTGSTNLCRCTPALPSADAGSEPMASRTASDETTAAALSRPLFMRPSSTHERRTPVLCGSLGQFELVVKGAVDAAEAATSRAKTTAH